MNEDDHNKSIKFTETHRDLGQKSNKNLIRSSKTDLLDSNKELYDEVPERWFNMVAFCFCLFANGFQWFNFLTISKDFSIHYSISLWKIKMLSMIYFIIYPFVCIPEVWLFENFSIKIGYILSAGFTFAGSFLKIFVYYDNSISVCYIGQILCGLFRPLLLSSSGKIAANWFKESRRTLICSIICLSDTFGILVGYLWNLAFIKENATKDEFKEQMLRYMLSQCILVFLFCVPAFFIEKDKPEIFSSISQNKRKSDLLIDLKLLFKNKNFIFLLIPTFFIVGYYYIMGNIFNNFLYLYKITKYQCTVIYSVSITAGIISSLIISFFLDRCKRFKLFMIILCILGIVFQALFTFLLEIVKSKGLNIFILGLIFYILINAVVIPFYCIVMNYACEITHPVSESFSGGILMVLAQLCGIGGSYLFDHFINNNYDKPWIINLILTIFFIISLVFISFSDGKLIRYEIDKSELIKEEGDKQNEDNKIRTVEVEIKQK